MHPQVFVSLSRPASAPRSVRFSVAVSTFHVGRGASRTVIAEGTLDIGDATGPEAIGGALGQLGDLLTRSGVSGRLDGEQAD